jgi:hypothetical protein
MCWASAASPRKTVPPGRRRWSGSRVPMASPSPRRACPRCCTPPTTSCSARAGGSRGRGSAAPCRYASRPRSIPARSATTSRGAIGAAANGGRTCGPATVACSRSFCSPTSAPTTPPPGSSWGRTCSSPRSWLRPGRMACLAMTSQRRSSRRCCAGAPPKRPGGPATSTCATRSSCTPQPGRTGAPCRG